MSPALEVSPAPTPDEAAAIAAAVQAVLSAGGGDVDPRPHAYRSAWRQAAIREGVGLAPDEMTSR
ncbi:MAG: hypothetical protein FJW99_05485 [Actinobacteria bacterium]|nr:hypothetical protein [Actinomycetota bacterium]